MNLNNDIDIIAKLKLHPDVLKIFVEYCIENSWNAKSIVTAKSIIPIFGYLISFLADNNFFIVVENRGYALFNNDFSNSNIIEIKRMDNTTYLHKYCEAIVSAFSYFNKPL